MWTLVLALRAIRLTSWVVARASLVPRTELFWATCLALIPVGDSLGASVLLTSMAMIVSWEASVPLTCSMMMGRWGCV